MASNTGKGRVAIRDVVDKTAEQDPEYQKVVKELVEGHQKSGWLVQRGAFDRHDLQYIADFKESERQKEQDMRDMETSEFAQLRSRLEIESTGGAGASGLRVALKEKKEIKPAKALLPVAVKATPRGRAGSENGSQPSLKRTRTASPSAPEQPSVASGGGGGTGTEARLPHVPAEDSTQGQAGLQGLLGYGSDSEDGEEVEMGGPAGGSGQQQQQRPPAKMPAVALPNAAELLGISGEAEEEKAGSKDDGEVPPDGEKDADSQSESGDSC